VVNVYGARVERQARTAQMDDFFRRFMGEGAPGMPRERVQRSLGSAWWWTRLASWSRTST
jgi:hypothetical protein